MLDLVNFLCIKTMALAIIIVNNHFCSFSLFLYLIVDKNYNNEFPNQYFFIILYYYYYYFAFNGLLLNRDI